MDLEPVTGPDVELVRGLVQEHHQLTGSTVAERLLEDWGSSVKMFVKVWYLVLAAILCILSINLRCICVISLQR